MPIPTPTDNENRDDFIERCMADNVMEEEYPDADQRLAVCSTAWENKNEEDKTMERIYTEDLEIKAAKEERTLDFIASKEVVDRDADVVKVAGIDVKNYKKNPVVLWAHNYSQPPIAKATKVTKSKDGTLKLRAKFPEMEEYGFADTIYKLLKGGYLNAVSIGFMPTDAEDAVEHVEPGKNKGARRIFHKAELLEVSVVPVPANPEALIQTRGIQKALEDKVVDEGELKELEFYLEPEDKEIEMPEELKDELEGTVPHNQLAQKVAETIIEEIEEVAEVLEVIKEKEVEKEEKEKESSLEQLLEAARELKASREQAETELNEILNALKKLKGE